MTALNKQAHKTENERMAKSLAERNGEPVEGLRQRISELEEIATDYGMKFQKAQDALKHQALLHKSQMEAAEKRIAELSSAVIAPGIMRCAGCGFVLTKKSINMVAGTITAGDSKTEPCPNGCGPLWPVTWKEQAIEMRDSSEQWFEELQEARQRIAELEALAFNPALLDVIAERHRQVSAEGWTPEHDDQYEHGQLAGAASCYARHANARGWIFNTDPGNYQAEAESTNWPWHHEWWKPTSPRRDLVKAGALILAEIERIDRAASSPKGE